MSDEQFTTTVELVNEGGDFTRVVVRADPFPDVPAGDPTPGTWSSAPIIHMDVTLQRGDLTAQFEQGLDEAEATELIEALTAALGRAQEFARARGYYTWRAAGEPGPLDEGGKLRTWEQVKALAERGADPEREADEA